MSKKQKTIQVASNQQYDPRWFIWTIVFLLVSGIGLSAFITLSHNEAKDFVDFPKHITNK
jgi:hypothetical protein